jgi:hypothetical protein
MLEAGGCPYFTLTVHGLPSLPKHILRWRGGVGILYTHKYTVFIAYIWRISFAVKGCVQYCAYRCWPKSSQRCPELVFTKLILQILYWISEIFIHSRVFILDLPVNIGLWNIYCYILAGNWVVYRLFDCLRIMQECLKTLDNDGLWIPRKKEEIQKERSWKTYIVFKVCILFIRFHKISFVCENRRIHKYRI